MLTLFTFYLLLHIGSSPLRTAPTGQAVPAAVPAAERGGLPSWAWAIIGLVVAILLVAAAVVWGPLRLGDRSADGTPPPTEVAPGFVWPSDATEEGPAATEEAFPVWNCQIAPVQTIPAKCSAAPIGSAPPGV